MNRFGSPQRTRADMERDCDRFLAMARPEAIRAVTVDELMARHKLERKVAQYKLTMALQRLEKSA